MHKVEETASLLASLAPFSLSPTSEDTDARGHFVSQRRWATSPSAGGTAEGKLDKLNVDIIAGNTKYKFNGKTLLARIVGRVAHTSQNIVCASIDWFESVFKLRENTSLCSR